MAQPLMPKATAVWLVENTALTFEQIAEFCGLHMLEIQAIADGEVAAGIRGLDPVSNSQLDQEEIDRLVPTRVDFHHQYDTPRDASGHVKAMLVGHSVMLTIEDGQLPASRSSGVLFCEFDGPRDRTVTVQIWAAD